MKRNKILALLVGLVTLLAMFVSARTASASTATPDDAHPRCYEWVRGSDSLSDLPAPYTATQECFATVTELNAAFAADGFTKVATGWDDEHSPVRTVDFVTKLSAGCDSSDHYFAITNFGSSGFNNALDEIQAPNGSSTCNGMTIYGGINYGGASDTYPAGHWDLWCVPGFCTSEANWTSSLVIGTG